MVSFELRNPTRIVFGDGQVGRLHDLVAPGTKVLLVYGGEAIARTVDFFRRMGLPVRTSEVGPLAISIDDVVATLEKGDRTRLGEAGDIGPGEVRRILELAA